MSRVALRMAALCACVTDLGCSDEHELSADSGCSHCRGTGFDPARGSYKVKARRVPGALSVTTIDVERERAEVMGKLRAIAAALPSLEKDEREKLAARGAFLANIAGVYLDGDTLLATAEEMLETIMTSGFVDVDPDTVDPEDDESEGVSIYDPAAVEAALRALPALLASRPAVPSKRVARRPAATPEAVAA